MSNRLFAVLAVFAMGGASLAGCLGGPGGPDPVATNETDDGNLPPLDLANNTDDGVTPRNTTLDQMPHNHDYWEGKERITLIDDEEKVSILSEQTFWGLSSRNPSLGGTVIRLPDGAIVFEGTGLVELTLSWDDPTITALSYRYRSSGAPQFSDLEAVENKKTISIEVTPEMTDEPHASSSRWAFMVFAGGKGSPGVAEGKIHVKLDIVRMDNIELFPAHPDFFAGQDRLLVMESEHTVKRAGIMGSIVGGVTGNPPGDESFGPDHVIPKETITILVRAEITGATTQNPAADPKRVELHVRPADSAFRFRPARLLAVEGNAYFFKIDVEPKQGDSYYAKESLWRFLPTIDERVGSTPLDCRVNCFDSSVSGKFTAYAFTAKVDRNAWPADA